MWPHACVHTNAHLCARWILIGRREQCRYSTLPTCPPGHHHGGARPYLHSPRVHCCCDCAFAFCDSFDRDLPIARRIVHHPRAVVRTPQPQVATDTDTYANTHVHVLIRSCSYISNTHTDAQTHIAHTHTQNCGHIVTLWNINSLHAHTYAYPPTSCRCSGSAVIFTHGGCQRQMYAVRDTYWHRQ